MKPSLKFGSVMLFLMLAALYVADLQLAAASKPSSTSSSFEPNDPGKVEASEPVIPKISLPVRALPTLEQPPVLDREINPLRWDGDFYKPTQPDHLDSLAAFGVHSGFTPAPLVTFEGLGTDGLAPPDPVGDVGPHHYVQMVNISFQIWDKGDPENGIPPTLLQPDTRFNQLFTGAGGQCETRNDGDPIVLYDDQANRWLLSQFVLGSPFALCVALSTSPDPMGTYYLYEFPMPTIPDYPKFGAWPNAYYIGTNSGLPNQYYAHALNRNAMLSGLPASRQSFGGLANFVMPADADGPVAPPAGSPGIFYTMLADEFPEHPPGADRLAVYEFAVDWQTPANSSLTLAQEIPVAAFNYTVCGFFVSACIPQPGTAQTLDSLSYWPMFRFQYRNFGSYASLVGNFTVDATGNDQAAIRWFELRKTGPAYSLYQEGTYAPDTHHRWMGSIAMDKSGNIALGYSITGETIKPSIRYAARLASDPPGTLASEAELWGGAGVQTGLVRWGDYANLVVDPVNGCHFWFTAEYHDEDDSGFNWNTRIGVFQLPDCGGNSGTLTGQVTDGSRGLGGVDIRAYATITQTGATTTAENGSYALALAEGTYVVTATTFGYLPGVVSGVEIISGTATLQNFVLSPAPVHMISGTVFDAGGGWPLYARLQIEGYPNSPIWTDPATGRYQVELPQGAYTFVVAVWGAGYLPHVEEVLLTGKLGLDFAMQVDTTACNAPGYWFNGTIQTFDTGVLPEGWVTIDPNISNPQLWLFNDPAGRGNLTGGTGLFAIIDSDYYGPLGVQDSYMISPVLNFSDLDTVYLAFDTDFKVWDGNETQEKADVDISTNGGNQWTNLWHRELADGNYNGHVVIDISSYAAHQSAVLIRFHYYDANNDWWWQVDNVAYGALTCDPLSGGLVVGNVLDENFGTGIHEAVVTVPSEISVTTQATPEDPGIPDGFFSFFLPTGSYTATASRPHYESQTHLVDIQHGTAVKQDFVLSAGWLIPNPDQMTLSLGFGYSATLPLQLSNMGGVTTTFAISVITPTRSTAEMPWLAVSPLTGTLPAYTALEGQVVFSAVGMTETNTYQAHLFIENDTPYGEVNLPITLLAGPPAPSVTSSPDQTGFGMPGTTVTYTLTISNTGNVPDEFVVSLQNNTWESIASVTTVFLNPGAQAVFQVFIDVPSSARYLDVDYTIVVITGLQSEVSTSTLLTTFARFPHLQFLPVLPKK